MLQKRAFVARRILRFAQGTPKFDESQECLPGFIASTNESGDGNPPIR